MFAKLFFFTAPLILVLAAFAPASAQSMQSNINEAASVAEQSSASTEEVSASTEQTSASAEQMSASAQELSGMAETLNKLMAQFKLSA